MSDSNSAANARATSVFAVLVGVPWCNNGMRSRCTFVLAIASCGIFAGTAVRHYRGGFDRDCADAVADKYHRPANEVAHFTVISRLQITPKEISRWLVQLLIFLMPPHMALLLQ